MARRFLVCTTCTLCSFLALVSCGSRITRHVPAKVLAVEGKAQAERDHQGSALTMNQSVQAATKIVVPPGGQVDLMLLPKMLLELSAESEVEIVQLQVTKDGDETIHPMIAREARIRLRRGTLVASVGRGQTRARLFIETDAGTIIASSGSTLKLTVDGERGRVVSVRGRATFRPVHAPKIRINRGFYLDWPADPLTARAASAAGHEVQAQVLQILKVERHLSALAREHHSPSAGKL